jgi:hypothetical protein
MPFGERFTFRHLWSIAVAQTGGVANERAAGSLGAAANRHGRRLDHAIGASLANTG